VTVTSAALAIRTRNQISGLVTPEEEDAMMGCCPDEVVLRGGFRTCALHVIPRTTLVARPSKAKRFLVVIGTALSGCPWACPGGLFERTTLAKHPGETPWRIARAERASGSFGQQPDGIDLQAAA
jgi:hypothetical protein